MPHGVTVVETELRSALAAAADLARARQVELQFAFEPDLVAQADPADIRFCMSQLLAAAIRRAGSGVLVTGLRRTGTIEIAVLDDGGSQPAGASDAAIAPPQVEWQALPPGATITADYEPDRGTTVVLLLPAKGSTSASRDADADEDVVAPTRQ